ncbi:flagellar biosynthesis regulator FlaF [Oceanicaulis sp.]|jgi:flagellar protein FlaF|uniref:flagellar biosynthesis regulator FlaF n=1 Tax=Oceanicaulis sp. TaxID=1924941 RepID=UPI003F6F8E68
MSYQAYKTASSRTEDPRQTEYRLIGEVTRGLMEVKDAPKTEIRKKAAALDRNRRVWSAFAADCASDHNNLPDSLRAGIISLSIFVSKETSSAMRGETDLDTLIDINRMIMQGLSPS